MFHLRTHEKGQYTLRLLLSPFSHSLKRTRRHWHMRWSRTGSGSDRAPTETHSPKGARSLPLPVLYQCFSFQKTTPSQPNWQERKRREKGKRERRAANSCDVIFPSYLSHRIPSVSYKFPFLRLLFIRRLGHRN